MVHSGGSNRTGETTLLSHCEHTSVSAAAHYCHRASPLTRESSRCVCAKKLNLARAWPSLGRLGIVRIPSYGIICRNTIMIYWWYE